MPERTPYSRSEESKYRERNMRELASRILGRLGSIVGTRSPHNMQIVEVDTPTSGRFSVWVKCAWAPGRSGNCAVQMDFPGKESRAHTGDECVRIVSMKAERAAARGANHLLLLAADDGGAVPLAAYLLPLSRVEGLVRAAVEVDTPMTLNGASPSLYIVGKGEREAALVHIVKDHATDLLRYPTVRVFIQDALDDLDSPPPGVEEPLRRHGSTNGFLRDPAVRGYVIKRAKGRCELCGVEGFEMSNGNRYLEAHHIISLADQGPDSPANVIALCPSHHREAHYGIRRNSLEEKMVARLLAIGE